jgi:hypothetical protein
MGAYSRHRLRQLVFGGVTEHLLFRTGIAALMLTGSSGPPRLRSWPTGAAGWMTVVALALV